MGDLELQEEKPLTMVEVQEELEKIEKRDKELTARATKTKEYLNKFVKKDKQKVRDLRKKLNDLNITRLKDKQIVKIVDLKPKDMDSLKAIFAGEITLKQEDLQKVLECIK